MVFITIGTGANLNQQTYLGGLMFLLKWTVNLSVFGKCTAGSQEQQQFDAELLASVRSQESTVLPSRSRWPGYGKCRWQSDGKYMENQSSNIWKMTVLMVVLVFYMGNHMLNVVVVVVVVIRK